MFTSGSEMGPNRAGSSSDSEAALSSGAEATAVSRESSSSCESPSGRASTSGGCPSATCAPDSAGPGKFVGAPSGGAPATWAPDSVDAGKFVGAASGGAPSATWASDSVAMEAFLAPSPRDSVDAGKFAGVGGALWVSTHARSSDSRYLCTRREVPRFAARPYLAVSNSTTSWWSTRTFVGVAKRTYLNDTPTTEKRKNTWAGCSASAVARTRSPRSVSRVSGYIARTWSRVMPQDVDWKPSPEPYFSACAARMAARRSCTFGPWCREPQPTSTNNTNDKHPLRSIEAIFPFPAKGWRPGPRPAAIPPRNPCSTTGTLLRSVWQMARKGLRVRTGLVPAPGPFVQHRRRDAHRPPVEDFRLPATAPRR